MGPSMEIINGRRVFHLGVRVDTNSMLVHDAMMRALSDSIDYIEANKAINRAAEGKL